MPLTSVPGRIRTYAHGQLAVRAGAWSECELARVGEAETRVAGRAFGKHGGEDASPLIEVVVDFGRGLVLIRAQDPAHILGQASLVGDRRGEEQGIQGRAGEAFASVRTGGHDQERLSGQCPSRELNRLINWRQMVTVRS